MKILDRIATTCDELSVRIPFWIITVQGWVQFHTRRVCIKARRMWWRWCVKSDRRLQRTHFPVMDVAETIHDFQATIRRQERRTERRKRMWNRVWKIALVSALIANVYIQATIKQEAGRHAPQAAENTR